MPNANFTEVLRKALEIRPKIAPIMLLRRNVVGVGVGYKTRAHALTDEPSVVISVTRKQPPDALTPDDVIPPTLDGVATDVVQTGQIVSHSLNRRTRQRPVRPGVSIGHPRGSAGTLGGFIRRDGEVYLLSNNHVIAILNQAAIGDPILQPGPADGGTLFDQIAQLADYTRVRFLDELEDPDVADDPRGCGALLAGLLAGSRAADQRSAPVAAGVAPPQNTADAAPARPGGSVPPHPPLIDVEGPPTGIALPELGMRVIKSGRTTGLTKAQIIQIDVTVDVQYGSRVARYTNQIMTTALSEQGDSGSLVLDYKRRAVGLLFSGSDTVSVVSPIQAVLDAFGGELVTAEQD